MIALRAKNRSGWSTLSPILTTLAGTLPKPPAKAPTQVSTSPSAISFSWQATTDIGGGSKLINYHVYNGSTKIATVAGDVLTYTFTTVTAGNSYLISISAESDIDEGT